MLEQRRRTLWRVSKRTWVGTETALGDWSGYSGKNAVGGQIVQGLEFQGKEPVLFSKH